jgi:hypothetical protein
LPHTALEEDRIKIDAAIKAVVVSIVRERETEVENWKEKIELARKDVVCLGKALGNRVVGTVDESDEVGHWGHGQGKRTDIQALPRRHEKLLIQRRELEQVCSARSPLEITQLTPRAIVKDSIRSKASTLNESRDNPLLTRQNCKKHSSHSRIS